jgi:RNA polymerase sigma-70 factor (ECF subfamily)
MGSRDQRETKAFEMLVRENSRMLMTYLRSLVSDEAAVDDLFQETMVVAWRRMDDCDLTRPFGPWLRGIAARLVMAHFRKNKRLPLFLDEKLLERIDERIESIHTQDGDTWEEKLQDLEHCIDSLPTKYQDVIRIRYLDDATSQVVAEKLNLSREACKKRLQRARQRIGDCLKRKGLLLTEGVMP